MPTTSTLQRQAEALDRAETGLSMANFSTIFIGFSAMGIPADDIQPRVNVFTYNAWRAKGRQVRRGEHGIKIISWIPTTRTLPDGTTEPGARRPRTTTVFHITQTEEIAR